MNTRVKVALLSWVVFASSLSAHAEIKPFQTDGCSSFFDGTPKVPDLWVACCVIHDIAYFKGGPAAERKAADKELKSCVQKSSGDKALAALMFAGVKLGGGPVSILPWRWGYGWPNFPLRGYRKLSLSEERDVAAALAAFDCPTRMRDFTKDETLVANTCAHFKP